MKIESELLFTIEIPKELKNGNTGRTKHWSSAHKDKQAWVKALSQSDILTATGLSLDFATFKNEVLLSQPVQSRVGLVVERVLGKRQRHWDADSALRGAKELIDSIVFHGILDDDSHKHVAWCVGLQDDTAKDQGPFTRVHFYEAQ
jgi:hypothetical protein